MLTHWTNTGLNFFIYFFFLFSDNQSLKFGEIVSTSNSFRNIEEVTVVCSNTLLWSMRVPHISGECCVPTANIEKAWLNSWSRQTHAIFSYSVHVGLNAPYGPSLSLSLTHYITSHEWERAVTSRRAVAAASLGSSVKVDLVAYGFTRKLYLSISYSTFTLFAFQFYKLFVTRLLWSE